LAYESGPDRHQPGKFPPGPREALDQARADRVAYRNHDEGDRRGRELDRTCRGRASRDDDIRLEGNKFRDERWEALVRCFGPAVLDSEIPALDVAALAKPLAERPDEGSLHSLSRVPEETDPIDLPGRLDPAGKRRGEEATSYGADELASVHWNPRLAATPRRNGVARPARRIYHQPASSGPTPGASGGSTFGVSLGREKRS